MIISMRLTHCGLINIMICTVRMKDKVDEVDLEH